MIFCDVETLSLHSPLLSIQWAKEFEQPKIHFVWEEDVEDTLALISELTEDTVVMWNGVFDWFHLTKWFNIFSEYYDRYGGGPPNPYSAWRIEQERPAGWCLKPEGCIDLKSVCSKGMFQNLARHRPITIRKVPSILRHDIVPILKTYLSTTLPKGTHIHWVYGKDEDDLFDLKAEVRGGLGLKNVHRIIAEKTGVNHINETAGDVFKFTEFASAYKPWGGSWGPHVVKYFTDKQIEYSLNDVIYMQDIWKYLTNSTGKEPKTDVDSKLCIAVGAARWKGFSISLTEKDIPAKDGVPTAPNATKEYLLDSTPDGSAFAMLIEMSTKKAHLELMSRGINKELAGKCKAVLKARKDQKLRDVMNKLLEAGIFCPDMKVAGTLTNRMAGGGAVTRGGSINPQGIDQLLRKYFTLAYEGETLSGGDFDGFEVSIADAVWSSKNLHEALTSGKSVHGIYGASVFNLPYEDIVSTKGDGSNSLYARSKKSFFAGIYGAQEKKQSEVLGLSLEQTRRGINKFREDHPEIGVHYKKLAEQYTFIDDTWNWSNPKEKITTIMGFTRKFDVEVGFARACFRMADDVNELGDPQWGDIKLEVQRRDRKQFIAGAVRSALLGVVFSLQHRVLRVAGNTEIQSPGGEITKALQERLWRIQPGGISEWRIRMLNVHDELMAVHSPEILDEVERVVNVFIEDFKEIVPLLSIGWRTLPNWAGVKG
tara:strand:- start:110 stop:2239 length:2130 start_codon:yes stop_codon:yes gene_type:complete